MRNSVANAWIRETNEHEGIVPWLYLDSLGLVTTALGNLVEEGGAQQTTGRPNAFFFTLPWKNSSGAPASRAEMQQAFDTVKSHQELAGSGGGSQAFARLTSLRLGPPGTPANVVTPEIQQTVKEALDSFEQNIYAQAPGYINWPADAQFAILEWAWAKGASFSGWPKLHAALTANPPDFQTALRESHISNATPARNAMTEKMWTNAVEVQRTGADPDRVYYPGTVANPAPASATPPVAYVAPGTTPGTSWTMPASLPAAALSRLKFGSGLAKGAAIVATSGIFAAGAYAAIRYWKNR